VFRSLCNSACLPDAISQLFLVRGVLISINWNLPFSHVQEQPASSSSLMLEAMDMKRQSKGQMTGCCHLHSEGHREV